MKENSTYWSDKFNNISNQNSVIKAVHGDIAFSILGYFLCAVSAFLLSLETNYTNLKNGPLIILLFYIQLLLITANIFFINTKGRLNNTKFVLSQKIEIILRFVMFLIINFNLSRFKIYMDLQDKFIVIICSVFLSAIIIVYQNIKVITTEDLMVIGCRFDNKRELVENNKQNIEHISLSGLVLYFYSVSLIDQGIGLISFLLKLISFCFAINLITKKLKTHYSNLNQSNNKLYLIISGLYIGFILNFVVLIILRNYVNYINVEDLNAIKDVMFIFALLCTIPLFKEYTNLELR